jgi:hypothetical protein
MHLCWYIECLTGDEGKTIAISRPGLPNVFVICRGCKFPAVKHVRRAVFSVCQIVGYPNPFANEIGVINLSSRLSQAYVVETPTGMYDPATMIPLAFAAIDSMPGWTDLHRLRAKPMFLLSTSHGLRPSSLAEYCPWIDDILLPPLSCTHLWLPNGMPTFILIGYRRWKGRKEAESGVKHISYLKVYQNTKNSDLCTMTWIFLWLGVTGLKQGPLFPVIHKGTVVMAFKQVLRRYLFPIIKFIVT